MLTDSARTGLEGARHTVVPSRLRVAAAGAALAAMAGLGSLPAAADGGAEVETIEVTAQRLSRDLLGTPAALSVVDALDAGQARQNLQLDEALNRVPGVYLQNRYNFAQNVRLSIRGFGSRAPFGIRGVRVIVDGLPETTPDGQSQVDAIDLLSVDRIEVLRGPNSALYGNATGGVVNIHTASGEDTPELALSGVGGSYGFRRAAVQAGGRHGDWHGHFSAWHMDYDGYREQSRARKSLVRGRVGYDISDRSTLTALFTYLHAPTSEDPGGLTAAQVADDRRQANMFSRNLDAGQDVDQWRLGLVWDNEFRHGGELLARAFYTQRDFRQQLPFPGASIVGFDRDFYGVGVQYANEVAVGALPLRYIAGVDAEQQRDDRDRFRREFDGSFGPRALDQVERAGFVAGYLQGDLDLTERLTVTAGARFDRLRFRIDDRFQAADIDLSGRRNFSETSLTAGLSYALDERHRVYVVGGTAFETPTFTEFANPVGTGGFNPELSPQEAESLELGMRGRTGTLEYEAALHFTRVRNELTPFQLEDSTDERTFFRNAGRTQRNGVEFGARWQATETLSVAGSYTWSDFEYRHFEDAAGNRFDGNRLPGIPRQTMFGELAWRDAQGRFAIVDVFAADSLYTENANTTEVGGYAVWNARAGMIHAWNGWEVETFVAVNNLLDREYFSNIRINDANGRFYEPAPERNWFAGFKVRPPFLTR